MARRIKIAVAGCGEAAQILHLPALRELQDLFEVAALCDISPETLAAAGAEWPGAERFTDAGAMIASNKAEAVVVCNPHAYHAETAISAMRAGKHVLIEKPMCVTLGEADALIAAEKASGVIAQVGYMRRYAPAYREAAALAAARRGEVRLARVHCVIGRNALFTSGTSRVVKGAVPEALAEAARARLAAKTQEAAGVSSGPRANAYALLLGLSSHDLSAMRGLIGMPQRVLYCALRQDGRAITAAFDYGGFVCQFETAIDAIGRFDAHVELYTLDDVIRIAFTTPYIRHQPAVLTVTSAKPPAGISTAESFGARIDSFVLEWRAFHENIISGKSPETSIADAREDLALIKMMLEAAE